MGGSSPGGGWEFFSSPTHPERLWGSDPASYPMGTRGSFPGREADHSPPSSAEVKVCVELYIHYPITPLWRGAQLKHRDNFTFTLITNIKVRFLLFLVLNVNGRYVAFLSLFVRSTIQHVFGCLRVYWKLQKLTKVLLLINITHVGTSYSLKDGILI
jgi:hypothetical protein